jgi:hypothetical protein
MKPLASDANEHIERFFESVRNGEYEEFEGIKRSQLKPPELLKPGNAKLLRALLECFVDTSYSSPTVYDRLSRRGIRVELCS